MGHQQTVLHIQCVGEEHQHRLEELMTAFYTRWLNGETKREAFRHAQETLKQKYNHAYYWGAFVMVGD